MDDEDEFVPKLAPADTLDPILGLLKKDIDYTLLIENLRRTPAQQFEQMERAIAFAVECRRVGGISATPGIIHRSRLEFRRSQRSASW